MSETTGQRHTNQCINCGVVLEAPDNWYKSFVGKKHYKCKSCYDERRILNKFKQKYGTGNRMLAKLLGHKTAKTFEKIKEGEVYIIYNPSFPSWIKVGMAVDSEDRLKQYQTGSPYRDYRVHASYPVSDRRKSEAEAHELLSQNHERKGEWFVCSTVVAETILNKHFNTEGAQFELF
jgi:hypothetical protein